MTTLQPQRLVHRGVVPADGLYFDPRLLPLTEARQRVLALWTPGATVYRLPQGLLLRLSTPQQVHCATAPGLPLVHSGGLLSATPLTAEERRKLNAPPGSVVLVFGGNAVVYDLAHAEEENPSDWFDIVDWNGLRGVSLGVPPAPPRVVAEPEPFDARTRLPGVPPAAPERVFVLEALRKAARGERVEDAAAGGIGGAAGDIGGRVGHWLGRLLNRGAGDRVRAIERGAPAGSALQWLAAKLVQASGLSGLIGRRQAEYIGRMLEMFERGDLHDALRHAIPMDELEGKPMPPALGVPTPRPDLSIGLTRTPASSSFQLAPDLHQHMLALYRQAFNRLAAEGRIDEAAFVLAELLGVSEEAVAFLERHGRLRLAAEMAEARKLPPEMAVRLWFLAGDPQRAVLIARRTGAFFQAVTHLERTDPGRAQELRLLWAETRATAGDYVGALRAIEPALTALWSAPEIRQRVATWIDAGLALGGTVGAQMLARKLALFPDEDGKMREQALTLLGDESAETTLARLVFARTLVENEATPLSRSLARAAARTVLRDAGTGASVVYPKDWQQLLRLADDAALRADAPTLPQPTDAATGDTPLRIQIAPADVGIVPLYDAALLPDGRCILALGEAGLRLITRDGRTVTHADQPAHRLAVSDHGNQVIALAPRGDVWRMARMNLLTRKAETWREAALRAFAPDHDGSLWFVAIDKDFLAIDVTAPGFDALWRLPNLEGSVLAIARTLSPARCSFLLFAVGATDSWGRPTGLWTRLESWTHSLPEMLLRERRQIPTPPPNAKEGMDYVRALDSYGIVFTVNVTETRDQAMPWELRLMPESPTDNPFLHIAMAERPALLPLIVSETYLTVPIRRSDGIHCYVVRSGLLAEISLGGAQNVSIRETEGHLVIADDRGRLLVLDPYRKLLLRDLRLK